MIYFQWLKCLNTILQILAAIVSRDKHINLALAFINHAVLLENHVVKRTLFKFKSEIIHEETCNKNVEEFL